MNKRSHRFAHQKGAVLIVALVLLLVLTLLAVSGVREATLESRITANKAHALQLSNASDAALREAEFRYFNVTYMREKADPFKENCSLTNKIRASGANKPCLLPIKADKEKLKEFVLNPLVLQADTKSEYLTGAWDAEIWMPYRGRDASKETQAMHNAQWNTYLISGGPGEDSPANIEYGNILEFKGTYLYLANGKASDGSTTQTVQSTFAFVSPGI